MTQRPMHIGSDWDCGSDNELQVLGQGPQPTDELIASGMPEEIHYRLGYRNVTAEEAKQLTGHTQEGWVIQYRNPSGEPYQHAGEDFYRLKPAYPGKGPKYLSGKGSGCRPYWSTLFDKHNLIKGKQLNICEGEKKADCLNYYGLPTLGLSGITCWMDKRSGTSQPLPELLEVNWKRPINVIFDSDLTIKESIQHAIRELCCWLAEQSGPGNIPKIIQIPCELNGDKNGPDDFIKRHGVDAFSKLIKIARPCGRWVKEKFEYTWKPEPKEVHFIALPFSTVLKEHYAEHPQYGTYGWECNHWRRLDESKPLHQPIHELMDEHRFHARGNHRINSIVGEVEARLKVRCWDDSNLVAFSNGTLNYRDGIFRNGHDLNDRLTFCFPFPYDPTATCPLWQKFLHETYVKPDGSEDPDAVTVMRAAIRWTICTKDTDSKFPHEVSFDVGGPKGCGKGVTMEILRALCGGSHGAGTLRSKMFGDPDSMASLLNKKAAIDPDASGIVSDPGCFNSIVSNEPVQIWIKYKNKCDARLACVVWRFYNDQPRVADDGGVEGMARRIITFSIPFSVENKDRHLLEKLKSELPGIYQWAMNMTADEMESAFKGAGEVETLQAASIDAQLDANPWLRFLFEVYPVGFKGHPARELYLGYVSWCRDQGMKGVISNTKFGRKLQRLEQYNSTLHKRITRDCNVYDLNPMRDVDLAHFFGMKTGRGGFNP